MEIILLVHYHDDQYRKIIRSLGDIHLKNLIDYSLNNNHKQMYRYSMDLINSNQIDVNTSSIKSAINLYIKQVGVIV